MSGISATSPLIGSVTKELKRPVSPQKPSVWGKPAKVLSQTSGLQKVAQFGLAVAFVLKGIPGMEPKYNQLDSIIDAVGTPGDITRFFKGTYTKEVKEGRWNSVLGNLCMVAVNIGGTLLFIGQMAPTALENIGKYFSGFTKAIGHVKVFGYSPLKFIPHMSVLDFVMKTVTLGYALLAFDAFEQATKKHSTKAWLTFAGHITELAAKILFFSGAGIAVLGATKAVAALIGIGSHVYEGPKDEIKDKTEKKLVA